MNELTRIRIEHSRQLLADTTFDLRWARRLANPEQEHTLLYQDIGSLRAMLEIMVEDSIELDACLTRALSNVSAVLS
jgi:hypothetical protein